jgi:hypothetical protein
VTTPDAEDLAARLARIEQLTEALAKVRDDAIEQLDLAARIRREIQVLRLSLNVSKGSPDDR